MLPIELDVSPTKKRNSARGGQHYYYYYWGAALAWAGVLMEALFIVFVSCCKI